MLTQLLWIIGVLIALVGIPLFFHRHRTLKRTKSQVAKAIEDFVEGSGGPHDWDDFTSIPIGDRYLDAIRLRCNALREEFPPSDQFEFCSQAGVEVMKAFISELRSAIATERNAAARLAREFYDNRITFDNFILSYPRSDDEDVQQLYDLIEHQPPTSEPSFREHRANINRLMELLSI